MEDDYCLLGLNRKCSEQELERALKHAKNYYSLERSREQPLVIKNLNIEAIKTAEKAYTRIKNSKNMSFHFPQIIDLGQFTSFFASANSK